MQSILQVNFWQFILRVILSKFKGFLKSFLVSLEINCSFDQTIFYQEVCAFLKSHVLRDFDCNLSELLLRAISFCYSQRLFPHISSSVHIDGIGPSASLDVVMFSLFQAVFHF